MKSLLNVRLAERRMTKRELERLTGIKRTSLWHYSQDGDGIGRARLGALARIAEAIGCDVKDLFEE